MGCRRLTVCSAPGPPRASSGRNAMKPAVAASALKVQAALGPAYQVLEFDVSTRTAAEAAAAIGCTVAQIAKSLVFRAETSGRAVLVVASGVNRVDEAKVGAHLGVGSAAPTPISCAPRPALPSAACRRSAIPNRRRR